MADNNNNNNNPNPSRESGLSPASNSNSVNPYSGNVNFWRHNLRNVLQTIFDQELQDAVSQVANAAQVAGPSNNNVNSVNATSALQFRAMGEAHRAQRRAEAGSEISNRVGVGARVVSPSVAQGEGMC